MFGCSHRWPPRRLLLLLVVAVLCLSNGVQAVRKAKKELEQKDERPVKVTTDDFPAEIMAAAPPHAAPSNNSDTEADPFQMHYAPAPSSQAGGGNVNSTDEDSFFRALKIPGPFATVGSKDEHFTKKLKSQEEKLRLAHADLADQMDAVKQREKSLSEREQDLSQSMEDLQRRDMKTREAENLMAEEKEELARRERELVQRADELNQLRQQLRQDLNDTNAEKAVLLRERQKLIEDQAKLEKDKSVLNFEKSRVEAQQAILIHQKNELQYQNITIAKAQADVSVLKSTLELKQKQLERSEIQLQRSLAGVKDTNGKLQAEQTDLDRLKADLLNQITQYSTKKQDLDHQEEEVRRVQLQVTKRESNVAKREQIEQAESAFLTSFERNLTHHAIELEKKTAKLAKKEKDLNGYSEFLKKRDENQNQTDVNLATRAIDLNKAMHEKMELQQKILEDEKELDIQQKTLKERRQDFIAQQKQMAIQMQNNLNELKEREDQLKHEADMLQQQNKTLHAYMEHVADASNVLKEQEIRMENQKARASRKEEDIANERNELLLLKKQLQETLWNLHSNSVDLKSLNTQDQKLVHQVQEVAKETDDDDFNFAKNAVICAGYGSTESCTDDPKCSWCETENRCTNVYFTPDCRDCTFINCTQTSKCGQFSTCLECASYAECGWCQDKLLSGYCTKAAEQGTCKHWANLPSLGDKGGSVSPSALADACSAIKFSTEFVPPIEGNISYVPIPAIPPPDSFQVHNESKPESTPTPTPSPTATPTPTPESSNDVPANVVSNLPEATPTPSSLPSPSPSPIPEASNSTNTTTDSHEPTSQIAPESTGESTESGAAARFGIWDTDASSSTNQNQQEMDGRTFAASPMASDEVSEGLPSSLSIWNRPAEKTAPQQAPAAPQPVQVSNQVPVQQMSNRAAGEELQAELNQVQGESPVEEAYGQQAMPQMMAMQSMAPEDNMNMAAVDMVDDMGGDPRFRSIQQRHNLRAVSMNQPDELSQMYAQTHQSS
eukprot:GILK01000757.1.p1 GENE.GILK01000757.1~~GILK01000757.1.p1  ORF type:complete len:1010 (+),score=296.02 GILK01000757.1:66-3095(+)